MKKPLKNGVKMKESNIINDVLTLEQCKELSEMGFDMSDATTYWIKEFFNNNWYVEVQDGTITKAEYCVPTYTLKTMLSKLETFTFTTSVNGGYNLTWVDRIEKPRRRHSTWGKTMLECVFKMIKWCKLNNIEI